MQSFNFHLAFPVLDLNKTKEFYTKILDCKIGRSSYNWIDINFFGNQITAHLDPDKVQKNKNIILNDNHFPVNHFGVILPWKEWNRFKEKLQKQEKIEFLIPPKLFSKEKLGNKPHFFLETLMVIALNLSLLKIKR